VTGTAASLAFSCQISLIFLTFLLHLVPEFLDVVVLAFLLTFLVKDAENFLG